MGLKLLGVLIVAGLAGLVAGCGGGSDNGRVAISDVVGVEVYEAFLRVCEAGLEPEFARQAAPMWRSGAPPPRATKLSPAPGTRVEAGARVEVSTDKGFAVALPDPGPFSCEVLLRDSLPDDRWGQ